MKIGFHGLTASALSAALGFFLCLCPPPAGGQTKPFESTSKVKKVLLYNKVGGWVAVDGIAAVKGVFSNLAAAKGFKLVQLDNDSTITLEYLKQFQVIVWNNNTNGGASVPNLTARSAVLEYLYRGGGWMLIHNAGDHQNSWPGLTETMGATFAVTGDNGQAEVVLDGDGRSHKELKWMLEGFPEVFGLKDRWLTFTNTVRPLPGVTVVATYRGRASIALPPSDKSGDNVYVWAREVGKGRFFYNAIGFGSYSLMEQQDSIVPKLYWENLRYAAGDYQNGCADPASPEFDPAARIHVEAMCTPTALRATPTLSELVVSRGGLRMRIEAPAGLFRARLCDIRGALVWERSLPAGTREMTMEGDIRPGVYQFEIQAANGAIRRRLMLP